MMIETEIGWISNKKYWNNGYMSEAVNAVNNLSICKIVATCTDKNIVSHRVMEKCNMKRLSLEKNHKAMRNKIEVTYDKSN